VHSGSGTLVDFIEGADDGLFVGAVDIDGIAEGLTEGADDVDDSIVDRNEGMDDVDGSAEGVDDHDEVKGSQISLARPLLDPYEFGLK